MNNVISLQAYRVEKDCQQLFKGYKDRINNFTKEQFHQELLNFQQEFQKFPNHLLTIVKGQILLRAMIARGSTNEAIPKLLQALNERRDFRRTPDDYKTGA